jgi:hypothetical protein
MTENSLQQAAMKIVQQIGPADALPRVSPYALYP